MRCTVAPGLDFGLGWVGLGLYFGLGRMRMRMDSNLEHLGCMVVLRSGYSLCVIDEEKFVIIAGSFGMVTSNKYLLRRVQEHGIRTGESTVDKALSSIDYSSNPWSSTVPSTYLTA